MLPALLLHPLLASDVVGFALFGVFVVAILVLMVLTIRWTFRRDRELRAGWRQRQQSAGLIPYGIVPKGHEDDVPGGDGPRSSSST